MKRRAFLLGAFGLGVSPGVLDYEIRYPVYKLSNRGIKAVQLTDLHLTKSTHGFEKAASAVLKEKPDIVFLTGDYINDFAHLSLFEEFVQALEEQQIACASCLGNHDYLRDGRVQYYVKRALGESLLKNSSKTFKIKGLSIAVYGIDDVLYGLPATVEKVSADLSIGLVHNPDGLGFLDGLDCDLILCGHTHGGQIGLPILDRIFAPVKDKRFVYGFQRWKSSLVYVSRGIGSVFNVRLACPPEAPAFLL